MESIQMNFQLVSIHPLNVSKTWAQNMLSTNTEKGYNHMMIIIKK